MIDWKPYSTLEAKGLVRTHGTHLAVNKLSAEETLQSSIELVLALDGEIGVGVAK